MNGTALRHSPTASFSRELQAGRRHLAPHQPRAQPRRIGVAVVDDDPNERLLLKRTLARSKEFYCVACYADGQEVLDALLSTHAQAVLLDIRMPRMSGIFCAQRLKQLIPALTIIMVTAFPDLDALKESLLAGADGFLVKPLSETECCEALHYALAGGLPLAKAMRGNLTSPLPAQCSATPSPALLNERESAVMECIAQGLLNKQIAAKLDLSIPVVEYVIRRIYLKLGAANRPEAVSRLRSNTGTTLPW
jgi:DNA-binding NarL/FixJ family response regulator